MKLPLVRSFIVSRHSLSCSCFLLFVVKPHWFPCISELYFHLWKKSNRNTQDWGPMDENHPMLNRTWVAGDKIDNTLAEHLDADMLQTEQSFIQTWHSQHDEKLPGSLKWRGSGVWRRKMSWKFLRIFVEKYNGKLIHGCDYRSNGETRGISRSTEFWDNLCVTFVWFLGVGCNGGIYDKQFWDDGAKTVPRNDKAFTRQKSRLIAVGNSFLWHHVLVCVCVRAASQHIYQHIHHLI